MCAMCAVVYLIVRVRNGRLLSANQIKNDRLNWYEIEMKEETIETVFSTSNKLPKHIKLLYTNLFELLLT